MLIHKKYIFISIVLLVVLYIVSLFNIERQQNLDEFNDIGSNNFFSGDYMLQERNITSTTAFGFVMEFVDTRPARIKLSDGSKWFIADDKINMYRMLIEYSRDYKEPILLAGNNKFQTIGIFSTMLGIPELNGETKDKKAIQVSVPPSPQLFRLRKDRPWFNAIKTAIVEAKNLSDSTVSHLCIAFDSFESEIVDVRPASNCSLSYTK